MFQEQYGKVIDRVRQDHPGITVVVQSILPVSAVQKAKCSYVNNGRIAVYNALLEELAAEKDCLYLNVAEAVTGEDGCLRKELTSDGIHLNKRLYEKNNSPGRGICFTIILERSSAIRNI